MALASVLVAGACQVLRDERGVDSVRHTVEQAEALVAQGRPGDALALVDLHGNARLDDDDRFVLGFTRGWVRQSLAQSQSGSARERLLAEAIEHYRAALELRPGDLEASKNLTLALRDAGRFREALVVAESQIEAADAAYTSLVRAADLLADPRNPEADAGRALAVYERAFALEPTNAAAPARMLAVHERQLGRDAGAVFALCSRLAAAGLWDLAGAGLEAVMARDATRATQALEDWVELRARNGALDSQALARLPGAPEGELALGVDELVRITETPLELTPTAGEPPRASLDELTRLEFWNASERRRAVLISALHSLADAYAFHGLHAQAAQVYEAAVAYGVAGDVDLGLQLDVALDLAIHYHVHSAEIDADRSRLMDLVRREPLLSFAPDNKEFAGLARLSRTAEQMQQAHTVLGLIWSEMVGWKSRAQQHLEEAIVEAGATRAPALSAGIATGLTAEGAPVDPLDEWLDAARGYLELGAGARADEVYADALAHVRASEAKLQELDRMLYPSVGWYVGAAGGATFGHVSSSEFEDTLSDDGHDTNVDLDADRYGLKVCVGYRFDLPLALELGYTSLEGPQSTITELSQPPNTPQLLADVADQHPIAGKGFTLSAQWLAIEHRRFAAFARLGVWSWDSDVDVALSSGSTNLTIDESGVDLFAGLGCELRTSGRTRVRVELERYLLDDDEVDLLSIGLVFQP